MNDRTLICFDGMTLFEWDNYVDIFGANEEPGNMNEASWNLFGSNFDRNKKSFQITSKGLISSKREVDPMKYL